MDQSIALIPPESRKPEREPVSQVLQRLTLGNPKDRIAFGHIQSELGERTFGLLMIVFALPNCIPFPGVPGISFLTGMAVFYISVQLLLGRDVLYLPRWLSAKSFTRAQFTKFVTKTVGFLRALEKPVRPRLSPLVTGFGERLVGLVVMVHALTLALPIPMGNLPQGVSLILLALALIELDGLMAIVGYLTSLLAVTWVGLVLLGMERIVTTFTL